MKISRSLILFFLGLLSCTVQSDTFETSSSSGQQIIGTQAIGASYHFTAEDPVIEQAKRIIDMGSKIIKISVNEGPVLDTILELPFDNYFFWWRSDAKTWENGLSESDKADEYKATYNFTKNGYGRKSSCYRCQWICRQSSCRSANRQGI